MSALILLAIIAAAAAWIAELGPDRRDRRTRTKGKP